jgi:protein-tyrosine phosphatase
MRKANKTWIDLRAKFVDLEWQQRERLHEGMQSPQEAKNISKWARMKGDEVAERNRYMNVDPYSSNRIRLRVPEGQSDYINASPIKLPVTGGGPEKCFIATQVGESTCLLIMASC